MARIAALVAAVVAATLTTGPRPAEADARAQAAATRILYSSDWTGPSQLFAVDPSRRSTVAQLTFEREPGCLRSGAVAPCGFSQPTPSPDGRWVAYRNRAGALFVARADGSAPRTVFQDEAATLEAVAWVATRPPRLDYVVRLPNGTRELRSVRGDGAGNRVVFRCAACASPTRSPDGRSIAFVEGNLVVRRAGKWMRLRTSAWEPAWSPDGRRIAFWGPRGLSMASVAAAAPRITVIGEAVPDGRAVAWSPDGRRLAFATREGLRVHEVRTGRTRLLTSETASPLYTRHIAFAWSPDSRSIAYIPGNIGIDSVRSGPLRIATLAGTTRTVVAADAAHGGRILSVAWSRAPAGVRYRQPEPLPNVRVGRDGVLAPGPVDRLAADGARVAFESCDRVFVWSSASGEIEMGSVPPESECSFAPWGIHSLALAGDRVGVAWKSSRCNMSAYIFSVSPPGATVELGRNFQCSPQAYSGAFGHFAGAGSLLVFSRWSEVQSAVNAYETTSQQVLRAMPGGCPCPELASSPGPLVPTDVDRDRTIAYGTNETLLLDRDGATLLSLPVSPLAAQLDGDDIVMLLRARLRVYSASNGALRGDYPLPDVPSGGDGGAPRSARSRLELHDAARGLATYVFDGRVHVLRLADGADVEVGYGTSARFIDSGLVYADHSRIRLVRYEELPIR